jgi:hypothetical protein
MNGNPEYSLSDGTVYRSSHVLERRFNYIIVAEDRHPWWYLVHIDPL